MYGTPDTITQFYQVHVQVRVPSVCPVFVSIIMQVSAYLQLCGRAGRSGCPSRTHLFFSTRQKFKDSHLEKYCMDSENCRRIVVLQGLGCSEQVPKGASCCDGCRVDVPYHRLDILKPASVNKRKRCRKAHHVDKAATDRLKNRLN